MAERIFPNETSFIKDISENLSLHNGFLVGGYAIELYLNNARYRHHEDLDIIVPEVSYMDVYNHIRSMIDYPIHSFYKNMNLIYINCESLHSKILAVHILGFGEDESSYKFPFQLKITKPFQLSQMYKYEDQGIPVATPHLLLESKLHALRLGFLYPSRQEAYEKDVEALRAILANANFGD